MSVDAIQRQVKEQLDALYMEIAALIPEKEGRHRHTYTLAEARTMVKDACTLAQSPSKGRPHGRKAMSPSNGKGVKCLKLWNSIFY